MKLELSTQFIDPNALDIINRLQDNNFTTYLVGGCVRDLLIGIRPKDFDIVTMAHPEQVQKIIRPSFIIGKRFRLVLVRRGGQQFEISTFRALTYQTEDNPEAVNENIYGEPQEDALRRDFTINGLFYDPRSKQIIDYTNGMRDIEQRVVRMIGDPQQRIEQDPIRILRALRFAHKSNFSIETGLRQAIHKNAHLLKNAVLPRVREEMLKILRLNDPAKALWEAHDLEILKYIAPSMDAMMIDDQHTDTFFHYMNQGLHGVSGAGDPALLYSIVMYSYMASLDEVWTEKLSSRFDDKLGDFMRVELGMHRIETEIFGQAVNLVKQLVKNPLPTHMRPRHRDHLLTNRAFDLALHLAGAFHHLTHYQVHQWQALNKSLEGQKEGRRSAKDRL